MKSICAATLLVSLVLLLASCASSIVDSEGISTATAAVAPKPEEYAISIYFEGKPPKGALEEIGRVSARAWVLEKGMNALKDEARRLGADAIIDVKYERRFSVDYLQDLYFIDGSAVIFE